jgi:hypothetical protein
VGRSDRVKADVQPPEVTDGDRLRRRHEPPADLHRSHVEPLELGRHLLRGRLQEEKRADRSSWGPYRGIGNMAPELLGEWAAGALDDVWRVEARTMCGPRTERRPCAASPGGAGDIGDSLQEYI